MKKQHITPTTECIHIETTHIIADSIIKEEGGITNTDDYEFLGREDNVPKSSHLWESEW